VASSFESTVDFGPEKPSGVQGGSGYSKGFDSPFAGAASLLAAGVVCASVFCSGVGDGVGVACGVAAAAGCCSGVVKKKFTSDCMSVSASSSFDGGASVSPSEAATTGSAAL
jgi:hypothetical protein